jgi:hypothetical protein
MEPLAGFVELVRLPAGIEKKLVYLFIGSIDVWII